MDITCVEKYQSILQNLTEKGDCSSYMHNKEFALRSVEVSSRIFFRGLLRAWRTDWSHIPCTIVHGIN